MSRLIVKNLPNGAVFDFSQRAMHASVIGTTSYKLFRAMKQERFRELFAAFGNITDCTLKYTQGGKFRKFGFIGFRTEEEAKVALDYFNKSFIDTSRISVEICKSRNDPTKEKPWSKYSQNKSKNVAKNEGLKQTTEDIEKVKKKKEPILKELKKDSGFKEFLSVYENRSRTATWSNDTLVEPIEKVKSHSKNDYLNFDSESEQDSGDDNEDGENSPEKKLALHSEISDMDYLKSKVVKDPAAVLSGDEGEKDADQEKTASESEVVESSKDSKPGNKEEQPVRSAPTILYTIKLKGAPFSVTKQNVLEFLLPIKPAAIRIIQNATGNRTGNIFVDLNSEEDVYKALKYNNDYMGGRSINVLRAKQKEHISVKSQNRPWEQRQNDSELQEDLLDSGRLFVRNLSYFCTEEDLEALFSKYGPLSEIHFPIDKLTKKPKGFAFVTFLITEHAVKAYTELDGQIFQGRMLHILPSTVKKEVEDEGGEDNSGYKKQKSAKDKANSSSSHNWNTLFMGTSSVAEVIAQKYNTSKSQVLDHEGKGSVAVRVALGETQIVQEVRQFLLENGVCLDSFSQAASPRSKTVILVKNLPAGTQVAELQEVFGRFGDIGRVLLPEGGITAIVEFLEPTEAKQAFRNLAYTKFQHVPLYLEWAPMNVFSSTPVEKKAEPVKVVKFDEQIKEKPEEEPEKKSEPEESDDDDDDDEETLPGCTLFVKNLNFSTNEQTLKQVFSKVGAVKTCTVSKKIDKQGTLLSLGFGFVAYKKPEDAQKALRQLQGCTVDDHQLEIKLSERAIRPAVSTDRKKQVNKKQKSSKILVRNVPFQATVKEIRELFSTFGELKTVRLPKKMAGTGAHRGFGFVDFVTKQDAKRAFNALCHSTHLYGRRLVLEWADTEESVETLRRKTAEQYHGLPKKKKKFSALMEDLTESLKPSDVDE